MGTGGVEAGDLQQALVGELSRHQGLLLQRFAEHEARILDALLSRLEEPRLSAELGNAKRWSSEPEDIPSTAGVDKRMSLDIPVPRRGSTPSAFTELEQPVMNRDFTTGSKLSTAASSLRKGMSHRTDTSEAIDQTSRVATTLKELIGAERDVHQQVSGLRRRNSVLPEMAAGGWEVTARKAQGMLSSAYFEMGVAMLILVNAVIVGLQTNDAMRTPQHSMPVAFKALELLFLVAFTVELVIRIVAEGAQFCSFLNTNFKWNMFDFVLVVAGVSDAIFMAVAADAPNVSAIRLLRVLRLARVLRILRIVKFFSAFRVMVTGILGSLKVLSFAVMLLTLIMYVFAVVILQFAVQEFQDAMSGHGTLRQDQYDALLLHFDSLPSAIFSLYASILGGLDWSECAAPLMALNPILGVLFLLYIAFAVLCVLNIVTGVFVENANKITSQDEGRELLSQLSSKKEWLNEAIKLFKAHDVDGSGTIAWEEFKECAKDVRIQASFRKIGVDVETEVMKSLWELLDIDGDGQVDVDEFVMALQQIHGHARSMDMARVKCEVRQIRKKLDACLERAEERRRLISQQASIVSKRLDQIKAQSLAPKCEGSTRFAEWQFTAEGVESQSIVPKCEGSSTAQATAPLAELQHTTEGVEEIAKEPAVETQLPGSPEHGHVQ